MSDDNSNGNGNEVNTRRKNAHGVEAEGDGGVTTLEAIFGCLLDPRRRFVLYYLQDHETTTVDELARQVAAWETGVPLEEVDADRHRRIVTELVHTHLPKLAEALFIEYDHRSGSVRYTEPPALLDEVLRLLAQLENKSST